MNSVIVNDKTYRVIEDATDDIQTMFIAGRTEPVKYVAGVCVDESGNRYEVDWFIDADTDDLPDDASDWVSDWDTANEVSLLDD